MKAFLMGLAFCFAYVSSLAIAASNIQTIKSSEVLQKSEKDADETVLTRSQNLYRAVIGTNLADLTKTKGNLSIDVFLKPQAAFALNFSSYSQEEVREKLAGNPKLTVDRTQFGIGGSFYLRPLQNAYNLSLSPSLIFETEKDSVKAEKKTGVAMRALAIFKPVHHLMMQAGGTFTAIGSESTGDLYAGLGLLF